MATTWQDIHTEALRRIHTREWAPDAQIPNEADLAQELGCSRATVNRALRALAEAGWLERRRKAGTRVSRAPQRRAHLAIPLIRQEIEKRGQRFSHSLLSRSRPALPAHLRASLGLTEIAATERVQTLYFADDRPFALEERWVHLTAAPGFAEAQLSEICANEWLVRNAPFAHGTLEYSAAPANAEEARHLECAEGAPLMILERRTFGPNGPVTQVRMSHAPGHRVQLEI